MDPSKLKVTELRSELEKRGLPTDGLKSVLVARLQAALDSSTPTAAAAAAAEAVPVGAEEPPATEEEEAAAPPSSKKAKRGSPAKTPASTPAPAAPAEPEPQDATSTAGGAMEEEGKGEAEAGAEVTATDAAAAGAQGKKVATPKSGKKGNKGTPAGKAPSAATTTAAAASPGASAAEGAEGAEGGSVASPVAAKTKKAARPPSSKVGDLAKLAADHWGSSQAAAAAAASSFDASVVAKIYAEQLMRTKAKDKVSSSSSSSGSTAAAAEGGGAAASVNALPPPGPSRSEACTLLENSAYLEKYLWPHFNASASSKEHLLSICLMVNEKIKAGVPAWAFLHNGSEEDGDVTEESADQFKAFFANTAQLLVDEVQWSTLSFKERSALVHFWGHAYSGCFEEPAVSSACMRLVSLPLWHALSAPRLTHELQQSPPLRRHWQHLQATEKASAASGGGSKACKSPTASSSKGKRPRIDEDNANSSKGKKDTASEGSGSQSLEATFMPALVASFLGALSAVKENETRLTPEVLYCERCLEFFTDLLAQLHTRRFLRTFLDDAHVLEQCTLSPLANGSAPVGGQGFQPLLEQFAFYLGFEIADHSGEALSESEVLSTHLQKVHVLQRIAFKHYGDTPFKDFAFLSTSAVGKREALAQHLASMDDAALKDIGVRAKVLNNSAAKKMAEEENEEDEATPSRAFLLEVLLNAFGERESQVAKIQQMSLYPDEKLLWGSALLKGGDQKNGGAAAMTNDDEDDDDDRDASSASSSSSSSGGAVPMGGSFKGDRPLALPKLNLQFLSFHDYLLRAFQLFRFEAAYEIRQDLVDACTRLGPKRDPFGGVYFGGWARMATLVGGLSVVEVAKPDLGETVPAMVGAEVQVSLASFRGEIREEWEQLREHDILFLVSVKPPLLKGDGASSEYGEHGKGGEGGDGKGKGNFGKGKGGKGKGGKGKGGKGGKGNQDLEDLRAAQRLGIVSVRGCEVYGLLDEDGVELNDPLKPDERKGGRVGDARTLKVKLDPAQYHADMRQGHDVYSKDTLNVLVRRKGKENNFKAVLETIRDLMAAAAAGQSGSSGEGSNTAVPSWLHDLFLGYGDPASAHYKVLQAAEHSKKAKQSHAGSSSKALMPSPAITKTLDFRDTFLDAQHVVDAFPTAQVTFPSGPSGKPSAEMKPPFRLTITTPVFPAAADGGGGGSEAEEKAEKDSRKETVTCVAYTAPNPGPYPQDQPKLNSVRFTPAQSEAIRSGMNKGLTMVVGPPGTGKTDVAVQIIANLYHNHPNQKTLIVTHSNAALNDLFRKIMERDVLERHLLRLGSGVEKLAEYTGGRDFSKFGRVNYTLGRRQELLSEVQRLADSLAIGSGDVGYTCEGAAFFHLYHVTSRIEKFEQAITSALQAVGGSNLNALPRGTCQSNFPFTPFFVDAPAGSMWSGGDEASDLDCARGCFRHLESVFTELADFRAFELLRNHKTRANYLLLKQARIVAMTCTHAAIARRQLLALGFRYDNLVMEEAAQVLEVETVIPMLLQPSHDTALASSKSGSAASGGGGGSGTQDTSSSSFGGRLQRVCLIGDHRQLPPVVKNLALQKYSNLDQTLFTRFIRLGVPHVLLDQQGRARPEIAALYSWRYGEKLGNLPTIEPSNAVVLGSSYAYANAGFKHSFQFINVPSFMGRGESTPSAYFYQNLGEAEYCVACYQYMRLLGYPAHKISILTSYNGQKSLIRDVLNERCASHPAFGLPARVTTVDKYQGQQNDYILLSLVRTSSVGHLRDVRRLVVALSRARLGLYVFGRLDTFKGCFELAPAFKLLLTKPTKLELVLGERWPSPRLTSSSSADIGATASAATAVAVHVIGAGGEEEAGEGGKGDADVTPHPATELGSMVQAMLGMAYPQAQQSTLEYQAAATTDAAAVTMEESVATAEETVGIAATAGGAVSGEMEESDDDDDEEEADNDE